MAKPMLDQILKAINANDNAVLIGEPKLSDSGLLESQTGLHIAEKVYLFVAPKESMYSAEELNEFMQTAVPRLDPAYSRPYEKQDENHYATGLLTFDEKVGKYVTIKILAINDPYLRNRFTDQPVRSEEEKAIIRRIYVHFLPDVEIAQAYYDVVFGRSCLCLSQHQIDAVKGKE